MHPCLVCCSGLLLTFLTLKRLKETGGKMNWVWFYIHRYIRSGHQSNLVFYLFYLATKAHRTLYDPTGLKVLTQAGSSYQSYDWTPHTIRSKLSDWRVQCHSNYAIAYNFVFIVNVNNQLNNNVRALAHHVAYILPRKPYDHS